jgi:septum formation protein
MIKPLLLASASPRRRQILALLDLPYTVTVSPIDEDAISTTYDGPNEELARWLAVEKVRAMLPVAIDQIVITADTTVLLYDAILGKPRDAAHARELLLALRDRWHRVITGVAVSAMIDGEPIIHSSSCTTPVLMRPYSEDEIAAYIASGDPMDKAGAYGIQHPVFQPTAQIQGCYLNVVGLPLCTLVNLLAAFNIHPAPPTLSRGGGSAPPASFFVPPASLIATSAGGAEPPPLLSGAACPWSARCLISGEVSHDQ